MASAIYGRVKPTNSGLHLHDTPGLLRSRAAFRRLLRQIENDPGSGNAAENIRRYLAEVDEALAAREAVAA